MHSVKWRRRVGARYAFCAEHWLFRNILLGIFCQKKLFWQNKKKRNLILNAMQNNSYILHGEPYKNTKYKNVEEYEYSACRRIHMFCIIFHTQKVQLYMKHLLVYYGYGKWCRRIQMFCMQKKTNVLHHFPYPKSTAIHVIFYNNTKIQKYINTKI